MESQSQPQRCHHLYEVPLKILERIRCSVISTLMIVLPEPWDLPWPDGLPAEAAMASGSLAAGRGHFCDSAVSFLFPGPHLFLSWFTPLFWWRVSSSTRLKKGLGRDILYASKIRMSTCLLDLHLDVFKTFQRWHVQMESMILTLLPTQTLLPLLVITPNVLLSRNPEAILDHSVSHPLHI